MTQKNFKIKEIPAEIDKKLHKFKPILKRLLFNRGIKDAKQADIFLHPKFKTNDPLLLPNMDKAIARILQALDKNQKIMIFADYDADGVPGAVVLHDFFKKIKFENFIVEIPDRHFDGFGLNQKIIEKARDEKVDLIITIDCGTVSIEEVKLANKYKIDVIITDHHEPNEILPKAVAILNPKLKNSKYPDRELCGAGVVFKLVEGLIKKRDFNLPAGFEKWFLDMVGLATLSDMVPLIGENRIFAKYGLLVMQKTPRLGLGALYSLLKIKRKHLTEDDIIFSITPKINVASRLGQVKDAFKLLTTTDEIEAIKLAQKLNHINNERKGLVASMTKEINKIITERDLLRKNTIVLGNPNWRPSLLGLIAGNLAEKFNRPVFLWGKDGNGNIKGSCRAGDEYSILKIMEEVDGGFKEFGGHKGAGGFSVDEKIIHHLPELIENGYNKHVLEIKTHENKPVEIITDGYLNLNDLNLNLFDEIRQLAPFGMNNQKPIFVLQNTTVVSTRNFGKKQEHFAVIFEDKDTKKTIEGISFFTSEKLKKYFTDFNELNKSALVHLEKNTFAGRENLRLRLVE